MKRSIDSELLCVVVLLFDLWCSAHVFFADSVKKKHNFIYNNNNPNNHVLNTVNKTVDLYSVVNKACPQCVQGLFRYIKAWIPPIIRVHCQFKGCLIYFKRLLIEISE